MYLHLDKLFNLAAITLFYFCLLLFTQGSPDKLQGTTQNTINLRHSEMKNGKRRKKKGNIWWPWASYEDWVANNERSKDTNKTQVLVYRNGKLHKKVRNVKRKRKSKKDRLLKTFSAVRNGPILTENRLQGGFENGREPLKNIPSILTKSGDKEGQKLIDSIPEIILPTDDRILETKLNSTTGTIETVKNNSSVLKPGKYGHQLEKLVNAKEPLVDAYSTDDDFQFSSNSIIKRPETRSSGSVGSEEDNEIKKIYHSLPYWKESIVETATRNYPSDENECLKNNGGCEGLCINTKGSYRCHCPPGFRLDSTKTKCNDVNECLSRNGHGPCDSDCTNTWGSFHCSCDGIPGTRLATDGTKCEPLDDCAVANCSHSCVPTRAGPFCRCPLGLQLSDDWRTCTDINECADIETTPCVELSNCINTFGSYECFSET